MAKQIFKLFMMKPSEAWFQLSSEEQQSLFEKVSDSLKNSGGKTIIAADSSWSSREWMFFGVQEYPDIESLLKHAKDLGEMNWFRYGEGKLILGTEIE